MTWVGRPKSPLPQREKELGSRTHTAHKCGCPGGFEPCWCWFSWSPGVQAIIIPIIIHPSWGRLNGPEEPGYTSERVESESVLTQRVPQIHPQSHQETHFCCSPRILRTEKTKPKCTWKAQRLSRLATYLQSHPEPLRLFIQTHVCAQYFCRHSNDKKHTSI